MFDVVRAVAALRDGEETGERGDRIDRLIDFVRERGLYPPFHTVEDRINEPEAVIEGREYLMFGANNYLSLSEDEDVKAAATRAIDRYGIGPGGSRAMSGNVDIIQEVERRLADITGMEACMTLPTGYMANVGVMRSLTCEFVGRMPYSDHESVIFVDEYIHGSVSDGCRLAGVRTVRFRHNNLDDLRRKLEANSHHTNRVIVTEGIFCLEGEIIDVPAYADVAAEWDARLVVDDAHAIGVLGPRGGGSPDYHGCADGIDLVIGSMDKALGGTGGYVAGSRVLIDYLWLTMSSGMLSSALPAGMAGAMLEALARSEAASDVRALLAARSRHLRATLRGHGFTVLGPHDIPSVPLFIGNEQTGIAFASGLLDEGIFCPLMRWPAVPPGRSRFRFSLMARHEQRHLDALVEACVTVGQGLGVI